ncbi:MAG: AAA family ATPase [Puniceicoccales bacterium]|jgi:wobble nucleotide-excising tRNase|nr:AAA family ATPase [Puniceicoccales bacterium]
MKIDLSTFPDRFAENSRELSISKKVNFVFGKNGTGKSTIATAIREQFKSTHNVCVFDGYEGVVGENHRLNAIALGTENAEIQRKIGTIEKQITEIRKEVEKPEDKTENLFTKSEEAAGAHKKQENRIVSFYTESAKRIKNKTNPQIAKTSYDKNAFKDEIGTATLLSEDEITKHKATIKAEQKAEIGKITFPTIDLSVFLKSTNEILSSKVAQQQVIAELENNTDKQNFAREGLKIHKHEKGEKCAFCGNEISEERWALLGSYFNDEVKKLEGRIEAGIGKITSEIGKLDGIKDISKSDFYDKFTEQIKWFNSQIKNIKSEYKTFLESLKFALEAKKKNLFASSDELSLAIPQDFSSIQTNCDNIVDENNDFSKNLKSEQEKAKTALRLHEVKKALDDFEYDAENNKLATLESAKEQAAQVLSDKIQELNDKKAEKNELIAQTKDESKLAADINKLLKSMGVASFSLELQKDDDEQQKGQYQIKGHNGKIRPIKELSKGEKNIIAFLYFILSLPPPSENNKPKIVVLDDPMTSNDDTMQYLMTEQTRNFYVKLEDSDCFLLLTHNLHFYLNVRPNYNEAEENKMVKRNKKQLDANKKEKTFYERNGYFVLKNGGTHTTIQPIPNHDSDFKTSYAALWEDLMFLYENDKPISMLNNCRRIIETYMKFNNVEKKFYDGSEFVRKLFNVNSHSIDDQENELNGKTREEIKNMLYALFKDNNAEEHFKNYWG